MAITYNDHSILENRHVAILYSILLKQESDVFASLDRCIRCAGVRRMHVSAKRAATDWCGQVGLDLRAKNDHRSDPCDGQPVAKPPPLLLPGLRGAGESLRRYHFKHMTELNLFLDVNSELLEKDGSYSVLPNARDGTVRLSRALRAHVRAQEQLFAKQKDKQLFINMMLHSCDISNPWKPWGCCAPMETLGHCSRVAP